MNQRVFIDIETLPPSEDARDQMTSVVVRKLSLSGAAVPYDPGAPCTDEEFRTLSLHAEYGRILCIGLIVECDGQIIQHGVLGRDRQSMKFHLDEARTLRAFWKLLTSFRVNRDLIIGHNILEFDLPFLYKRSRILQVKPAVSLNFARYRSQPIYDTMKEWSHWAWEPGRKLQSLAQLLNIGFTKANNMDGSRIYDAFNAGLHTEVAEYCIRDVELMRAVYYRMNFLDAPASKGVTRAFHQHVNPFAEGQISAAVIR